MRHDGMLLWENVIADLAPELGRQRHAVEGGRTRNRRRPGVRSRVRDVDLIPRRRVDDRHARVQHVHFLVQVVGALVREVLGHVARDGRDLAPSAIPPRLVDVRRRRVVRRRRQARESRYGFRWGRARVLRTRLLLLLRRARSRGWDARGRNRWERRSSQWLMTERTTMKSNNMKKVERLVTQSAHPKREIHSHPQAHKDSRCHTAESSQPGCRPRGRRERHGG